MHYKLAPLDEPVMRVLMSAVTHVLSHCDAIVHDGAVSKNRSGAACLLTRRISSVARRSTHRTVGRDVQ